jgi:uncharacterized RDD family membrane protein YckC
MNTTEQYVHQVMRNVPAPARERERIESDLRAHLAEAAAAGQPAEAVVARMGKPEEVAAEFMATVPMTYAGFLPRALAFVVDVAVAAALAGGLWALGVVCANRVPQDGSSAGALGAVWIALSLASWVAAGALALAYFPLLEGRYGQTPGKRLLGLRVLKENGLPIGYKEAVLRRLSLYFEIWPLDALFVFFNEKRQRAFDRVARTVVVRG